jgi:hypothetical protein
VPTSSSRAPDASRISGIRNEPPIATSSPRETSTDRPRAKAASASITAEALLLTAIASSQPNTSRTSDRTWSWRFPRSPVWRSYSTVEYPAAASAAAARASSESGARPRFVWRRTPVALTARTSVGAKRAARASEADLHSACGSTTPAAIERRSCSLTASRP